MKTIILILFPLFGFSQKIIQQTTKNGTTHVDYMFKERLAPGMDLRWPVLRVDSPYYRFQMVKLVSDSLGYSRNDGVITNILHVDGTGKFLASNKNQLSIPFSQLTGSATVSQLPTIPYSKISDGPLVSGRTPTSVARAFNTAFTPSSTKDVQASYTVTIRMPLTLLGLVHGTVYMEMSPNGTTWTEVGRVANGSDAIVGSGSVSAQLSFLIPAGYQVRLRTVVAGAVTITYNNGFETIL